MIKSLLFVHQIQIHMDDEFDQWQQAVPVQANFPIQQQSSEQQSQPHLPEVNKSQQFAENNRKDIKMDSEVKKYSNFNSLFVYSSQPNINLSYNSWEEPQMGIKNTDSLTFNINQYTNINKSVSQQFKVTPQSNIYHPAEQTNVELMPNSKFQQINLTDQDWQQPKIQSPHYQFKNPSQGFSLQTFLPTSNQVEPSQPQQNQPIHNSISDNIKNQDNNNDDDQFGQFQSSTPVSSNTEVSKVIQVEQQKEIQQSKKEEKKQPQPYLQPTKPVQPIQPIQSIQPIHIQMSTSGAFQRPKIKKPVYSQQEVKRATEIINKIPDYSYINATYFIE